MIKPGARLWFEWSSLSLKSAGLNLTFDSFFRYSSILLFFFVNSLWSERERERERVTREREQSLNQRSDVVKSVNQRSDVVKSGEFKYMLFICNHSFIHQPFLFFLLLCNGVRRGIFKIFFLSFSIHSLICLFPLSLSSCLLVPIT